MRLIKVGAAALNQTALDWDNNLNNIKKAIDIAINQDISVLCLPELCITGYGCEDAFFCSMVQETALNILLDIVSGIPPGMIVAVGLPYNYNNCLYNTTAIISSEKITLIPKQNLAADGVHYEPRWFKSWPKGQVYYTNIASHSLMLDDTTIGDTIVSIDGINLGVEICEDAWVADRPGSDLARRGVDIMLNPSASHFAFGKGRIRERFVVEGSRAFRCIYIYANLLGNDSGRLIFDGECLIASGGSLLNKGKKLSFEDVIVTDAVIDIQSNRTLQNQNGAYHPIHDGHKTYCFHNTIRHSNENITLPTSYVDVTKEVEFEHTVALGLFDYMRKSKSNGFVLSLSGGADSSAVACLVKLMRDFALKELGDAEFLKKTGFKSTQFHNMLHCVYQKTENSSEETKKSAYELAKTLGATIQIVDIQGIVDNYTLLFGSGDSLNWEDNDIPLQNIQARVRSPGPWMIANIKNSILLCTSNRSESAVGYTTVDGDMSGGLAPIAGVSKEFLLRWLRYVEAMRWSKIPCLSLKPSAELRPQDQNQSDEQDLMPYDLLDKIEGLAIRDKYSPKEIYQILGSEKQNIKHIIKFFNLWCRNQWKREKFAIAFHLDDRNLDPKTWCRFPVLSGGFKKELKELEEMCQNN